MRLLTKVTLLYVFIALIVFAVGGVMAYYVIKEEIDAEHQRFLRRRLERTAELIELGEKIRNYDGEKLVVTALGREGEEHPYRFVDTLVWHPYLERMESHYKVSMVKEINGQYYYMETYDVIVEADDIMESVITVLSRIFVLLLAAFTIMGIIFSVRIFRPFNLTLERIRNFRLGDREPLELPRTSTLEFGRLNRLLEQMAAKSRRDYQSLKEFSENASHEIQTPLAIARGKLELLLDSPNLNDKDLELVLSAQQSLHKLSKLGQSLALLTRIENEEFSTSSLTDFSELTKRLIEQFEELAALKELSFTHRIETGVELHTDPVLADILLTNLFQNAVRHNVQNGDICVELDKDQLSVSNTGLPPHKAPEDMFLRFRKDKQSGDSLGLGLAIVKRICDLNQWKIDYQYNDERHRITVLFSEET